MKIISLALFAVLLGACGGGSDPALPSADATGGDSPPMLKMGPDLQLAKDRLLINANMTVPDAARIVSFEQTGIQFEGPPEMQSAIVNYEAELEFTADTYFHSEHKAGSRHKVYGEAEYLNEGGNWRLLLMGIHPR